MSYTDLQDWFWETAHRLPGYKPQYGAIYNVALHLSRKDQSDILTDRHQDIIRIAKVSRQLCSICFQWLDKHKFIQYEEKPNQHLPSVIKLQKPPVKKLTSSEQARNKQRTSNPENGANNELLVKNLTSSEQAHSPSRTHARAELVVNNYLVDNKETSSSCSKTRDEESSDDNNDDSCRQEEVPGFVEEHRATARQIAAELADRHPPIDDEVATVENPWCWLDKTPYTRAGFEAYLRNRYKGDAANLVHKATAMTVAELLPTFLDKRAFGQTFGNFKHVHAALIGIGEDIRFGKQTTVEYDQQHNQAAYAQPTTGRKPAFVY